MLKQIHQELVAIRKELQAVQIDLEHIRKHPFNVVTSLGHSSSYDTGEVNQKSGQLEIEELMSAIDEELDNCIKKFRNATRGNEVRTFITEYEELMLKKSDLVVKGFLKNERRTR